MVNLAREGKADDETTDREANGSEQQGERSGREAVRKINQPQPKAWVSATPS
jgi:hypothetical protein